LTVGVIYLPNLAGQLRYRVRELERERVTVQEAARQLGITESAVRKRAQRGQLRSEKATEGKKERLYIFLDPDEDKFPETFRERYIRSLEQRVNTLEDEVYRQQAILLNMTEAMKALSPPSQETPPDERESPQAAAEEPERAESQPDDSGAQEGVQKPWWRRVLGR
jgi:predicted ArsR family transcriptional regulator